MPKNQRPKRHLYNNQTVPGMQGLETITPPPSTPLTPNPSPASPQSISPLCAPVDLDSQTESNHDTALTLACHGGHAELVSLLLSKGADIEHRDKKGFTPLILAATAGHVDVVEILLDHGADMEAQSERTKDTPLSLACSGGRFEVVELLLSRGANKEHRNVSDYTPLSLAASGGY
ncbi:ANKRD17 [Mytilus edulis]|uniref:ANKRD17 n=2 Tax=Mytilus TaxID=6548 RepID=A0A8S3S4L8_MYTED|nr:ANKRD17 [Mytilus edulis]